MTIQLYEATRITAMTNDVGAVRVNRKKKNNITHKVTDHKGIGLGLGLGLSTSTYP